MSAYNGIERRIARWLESLPAIRNTAKFVYHRINYVIHGERGFQFALHPLARMHSVFDWAGIREESAEYFFGYYDKSPWSPDMQRILIHQITKERAKVAFVEHGRGSVATLGMTEAWNHQQGSMTQWVPGSGGTQVIHNDLQQGSLISRVVDLGGREITRLPLPIQVVHPGGREALSLNYKRLLLLRPEYGYMPLARNFSADQALDQDGVWRVSIESGECELLFSLEDLINQYPRPEMDGSSHKVNHFLYSPSGDRFVFMHRWLGPKGKFSRLYVANADGTELRLLLDDRMVSHYNWRDDDHLLAWARTAEHGDRYYLIDVRTGERKIVAEGILDVYGDGHPSYSPDRDWIATDTYPNRARQRILLLYHVSTGECIPLGRFFAPWRFDGVVRCDLHPRWSPDGKLISIDSAHEGLRKSYVIDVSEIVGR